MKLEFALAAKGGPIDGTALSAAIREIPRKSVSFNDCVQVKYFPFKGNEPTWRRAVPGSTARMWENARRKADLRREQHGMAIPSSPRVPDRLRMMPDKVLVEYRCLLAHGGSKDGTPQGVVDCAQT